MPAPSGAGEPYGGSGGDARGGGGAALAPLLPQLPGACWIARIRGGECAYWPEEAVPPRGTRELARRASAEGRVHRATACGVKKPRDGAAQMIAVPARRRGARDGTTSGGVIVVGLRDAASGEIAEIVSRVRAVLDPDDSGSAVAPARTGPPDRRGELSRTVLAAAGEHGDALACAVAAADAIATFGGFARVCIGVRRGGEAHLLAVSGEKAPDRRRDAVRSIEAAMREALRGDAGSDGESGGVRSVVHDAPSGVRVVARLESSPATGDGDEGSRPLVDAAAGNGPDAAATDEAIAPLLGLIGVLEHAERRAQAASLARACRAIVPSGRAGRRRRLFVTALLAVLVGVVSALPLPYRVSARVSVEASDRLAVSAPHDGHLASAHVRAGDRVAAGQLLATLDQRETSLALDKWQAEIARNRAEQAMALAARERVELTRLRAEATRLALELTLTEQRRAREEIRAPFDGVVLSGDPDRALGSPLAAGETLFELASSARRSLLVEVDEHDVALIEEGAIARVRMAAAPRRAFEAKLGEVIPLAVAEAGASVFRVPATLVAEGSGSVDLPSLRPGMQGVARIEAGRRSLADAWTRTVRERLVLLGWRLGLLR